MHYITAYYKFLPLKNTLQVQKFFIDLAEKTQTRGLVVVAPEGFNSTVSNTSLENLKLFKKAILNYFNLDAINFKDSTAQNPPFRRFVVKMRPEIVTSGNAEMKPDSDKNHHLTPNQWNEMIEKENPVIIDTRNWYEYKIGTFTGALNPNTDKFTEFPKYMESQNIKKNQKVMIFCTGGIRCEKGILELQEKGYSEVYQLDGGILNYLQEKPNEKFEGECFVFDHRVAVDQQLKPSHQYILCPHCGQPGKTSIDCKRCDIATLICEDCHQLDWKKETCSKNCAHHLELHPDRKGARQEKAAP